MTISKKRFALATSALALPVVAAGYSVGFGPFGRPVTIVTRTNACNSDPMGCYGGGSNVDRAFDAMRDEMFADMSPFGRRRRGRRARRFRDDQAQGQASSGDSDGQEDTTKTDGTVSKYEQEQEFLNRAFDLASDVASSFADANEESQAKRDAIRRRQREWVDRAFGLANTAATGTITPPYESFETNEAVVVRMDVPGIPLSDLDISVKRKGQSQQYYLTVQGERTVFGGKNTQDGEASARRTTKIAKSFLLGANSDVDAITATINNGVLEITIPKDLEKEKEEVKKIAVVEVEDSATAPVDAPIDKTAAQEELDETTKANAVDVEKAEEKGTKNDEGDSEEVLDMDKK